MAKTKPSAGARAVALRTTRIEAGLAERGLTSLVADVALAHHVTVRDIASMVRTPRIGRARWEVWARLRGLGFSFTEIAAMFEAEHSSVYYGVKRAAERAA